MDQLAALKQRLEEGYDLGMAASVLSWDQLTQMPPGGANARARQLATIGKLQQQLMTAPEIGRLLDELREYGEKLPYDNLDAALIRVAKREYDFNTRIPPEFVARFTQHTATTYQVWVEARAKNDFHLVEPLLEKTLDMSREASSFFPEAEHVADPFIALRDYGMSVRTIRPLFQELRSALVPLIEAIGAQPLAEDACLKQPLDRAAQIAFGEEVIRNLGYDFKRGRQDISAHPFTTSFSVGDVRITTRVKDEDFSEAFFSTVHEAGHAMYELGVDPALDGTLLAHGTSAGVHESQSRLWENVIGRGKDFWFYYYPRLQRAFPEQFDNVPFDAFYRAINKVQRSLIRTDADEVTYNLHVMIRFDLEVDMLEGKLEVRHLPDAWNERYRSDLGITPPSDSDGCMQDVHWYGGFIGGSFQGYTLGNIMSALFYNQALAQEPHMCEQIRQGSFASLHGWMKENIYRYGTIFTASELIERITGSPMTIEPYMQYLRTKFGEIYGL